MVPQEFTTGLKAITKTFDEQKKALGLQFRDQAAVIFKPFFDANPEVAGIKFVVSTRIYDDEEYSDGYDDFQYALIDGLVDVGGYHWFGGGPLDVAEDYVRAKASGTYDWGRYSSISEGRKQDEITNAKYEIAEFDELKAKMGERIYAVPRALETLQEHVEEMDITFAKIVFGSNVTVTVTRDGISIK